MKIDFYALPETLIMRIRESKSTVDSKDLNQATCFAEDTRNKYFVWFTMSYRGIQVIELYQMYHEILAVATEAEMVCTKSESSERKR
jgi:hypothetical protein